jgi:prepilin-type N-terminal cleavage/methylation domain-containing protein
MRVTVINSRGYSFIELIVVIVIVGIIASVAMRSLRGANDVAKVELTKQRLEKIANAIAGNPSLVSGGSRTSFGYVGDVGALPANLDALVANPGGYTTWRGPYIVDELTPDGSNSRFKLDGWGQTLSYSGGVSVVSNGGGTAITRAIAASISSLLHNQVAVTITDLNLVPPGSIYRDSVKALLAIPDGTGATTTKIEFPSADGYLLFDSIPIGQHQLRVVYAPNNDTLRKQVTVGPSSSVAVNMQLFRKVW